MAFLDLARKRLFSPIFTAHQLGFFSSSSATLNPDPKSHPSFVVKDYLMSTFGFSAAKAATVSKHIAHLKSPQKPDAVRSFLHHQGFGEAEIATIITRCPTILCSSPENTIAPKLRALRDMDLSTSALRQIVISGPYALQIHSAVANIEFWRDFVGGEEADLVRLFKRNKNLIGHNISGGIAKKISLLQGHGISTHDIRWIVLNISSFITLSATTMEETLQRARDLGFHPKSGMFIQGLQAMACVTRETLQKKMELYQSFGWSEEDFFSALQKAPTIAWLSKENLHAKMGFLLGEAKCDLSYITSRPILLKCSLEKKLRPRHHVLSLLESKDLCGKRNDFYSAICMSDNKFVAKYILPHQEELPSLRDVYLASCA